MVGAVIFPFFKYQALRTRFVDAKSAVHPCTQHIISARSTSFRSAGQSSLLPREVGGHHFAIHAGHVPFNYYIPLNYCHVALNPTRSVICD